MFIMVTTLADNKMMLNVNHIIRVRKHKEGCRITLNEPEVDERGAVNTNWIDVKEPFDLLKYWLMGGYTLSEARRKELEK